MSGDGLKEEASDVIEVRQSKSRRTEVQKIPILSVAGAYVSTIDCDDAGMALKRVLRKLSRACPATNDKDQHMTIAMTITTTAMTMILKTYFFCRTCHWSQRRGITTTVSRSSLVRTRCTCKRSPRRFAQATKTCATAISASYPHRRLPTSRRIS